ncbi:MAG: hypothetical protein U1E65_26040 [Myxococcota bacterium]
MLGALGGCSHDLSAMFGPEAKDNEAHAFFAAADLTTARTAYGKVLIDYPEDPQALLGAVLTDLLLITESAPVNEMLAICHQGPLDVRAQLFGPSGLISQSVAAGEGTSTIQAHYFASPGAGANDLALDIQRVYARIIGPSGTNPRRELSLTLRERDTESPRWVLLHVNADDIRRQDQDITPLADGAMTPLSAMDGSLELLDFGRGSVNGSDAVSPGGSVRFVHAGKNVGDAVEVELTDTTIGAGCSGTCGPGSYVLSGTVRDVISPEVSFDTTRLPFGTVRDDPATPRREAAVVALETCDPFDDRALAARIQAVAGLLSADAARLQTLLEHADPATFGYAIPKELVRAREDLPVNTTDVRALRGVLLVAAAALGIAAEYKYLDGVLQSEVTEFDWWEDGVSSTRPRRGFYPATLAMNLELGFMTKPSDFNATVPRGELKAGLHELGAALLESPTRPGLLSVRASASARLLGLIAGTLEAFSSSTDSAEAVPLPEAPHYQVHLARYFDDPLDAARIRQLTGLLRLFDVEEGTPDAIPEHRRNPSLRFNLADKMTEVGQWSDGLLRYPPIHGDLTCTATTTCPTGYSCRSSSQCELDPPWFVQPSAWQDASVHGWPAFLSAALRDALALDN